MSKQPRIVKHALIEHHLNGLKSPSASVIESRLRMQAMCDLVAFESMRELPSTSSFPSNGWHASKSHCVVLSIMGRYDGLGDSLHKLLPGSETGHICFVETRDGEPERYYADLPAFDSQTVVFLCDLVVDSTSLLRSALRIVKSYGAEHIKCLGLFATQNEVRTLFRIHPSLEVFCALFEKDSTTGDQGFPFKGIPLTELPVAKDGS